MLIELHLTERRMYQPSKPSKIYICLENKHAKSSKVSIYSTHHFSSSSHIFNKVVHTFIFLIAFFFTIRTCDLTARLGGGQKGDVIQQTNFNLYSKYDLLTLNTHSYIEASLCLSFSIFS